MAVTTFDQELLEEARKLDKEGKRRLLAYARRLNKLPQGEPGWEIVQHAHEINFPKEDLAEMAQAIEDYCEVVGPIADVNLDG